MKKKEIEGQNSDFLTIQDQIQLRDRLVWSAEQFNQGPYSINKASLADILNDVKKDPFLKNLGITPGEYMEELTNIIYGKVSGERSRYHIGDRYYVADFDRRREYMKQEIENQAKSPECRKILNEENKEEVLEDEVQIEGQEGNSNPSTSLKNAVVFKLMTPGLSQSL